MKTLSHFVIYSIFFLISFVSFSQTTKAKKPIPTSIYFLNSNYQFSTFNLNSKLDLNSYKFLQIGNEYFKNNQLTINAKSFYFKPSEFIYDSFQKNKEKEYLEKSFFKLSTLYDLPRNNKNL
ncbi:hypothetical protein R3X25_06640 [Lutibacter sp. TH_r2]|uniref:hypothetical protein n=1 Tax=Lutibacter sp. TH_r2 TaxID=3082083 RepID=UPI0029552BF6|nr:hypothetical protein [Lutibacter sp. TH_r2]MDV7186954.1 hypothetical protein [Lutibacter sp. TH_r2]